MSQHRGIPCAFLLVLICLVGCVGVSPEADLTLTPELLQQRQLQTRRFDTSDEQTILKTCTALLQDTGFNIDESETQLGIITGSKRRDATDPAQWALYIVGAFFGVSIPPDDNQIMKVCVTTRRVGEGGKQVAVRVVFERIVFNTEQQISKIQALSDPKIYQSFFEKLAKALFLDAHDI
jgi:hypothetical protein